jgi:hypothetical protein
MKNLHILSPFLIIFLLSSCSSSKKAVKNQQVVLDSLGALPMSEIDIPIKIYAPPILKKAEQIITKEFTSEAWPNYVQPSCDFRYKYRFLRSGLTVSCTNNVVTVGFAGNYQVAGSRCICSHGKPVSPWISGSCGFGNEPMRRVSLNIKSQLQFLPTYQARTSTRLAQMIAYDKCKVSLLTNDITDQILDSIKSSVNSFCAALDSTVAGLSLGRIWQIATDKTLSKNNLGKFGFLQINPIAIRVGQLNYSNDTFSISAGITCKPELSSDSNMHSTANSFPSLLEAPNKNNATLYVNMSYDYPFLSRLLSDTLYNRVFELKGRSIVIKKVEMRGIGNNQVEFKIEFTGSNKGSILLRGKPVLDTSKQSLTIQDLTYSLESQDLALKLAKTLFRNKIKKTIQGNSYLDIAALVRSNLSDINTQLSRKLTNNISTRGTTKEAKVLGILAREDKLLMQVYVQAEIAVIVKDLP